MAIAVDPDGDGVSNLFEYVENRNPWTAEEVTTMTESITVQNGIYSLLLSFPHNRNATDVVLSYEGTNDFTSWIILSSQLVSSVVTSSEAEQLTVRVAVPTPAFFVRVRATRQ